MNKQLEKIDYAILKFADKMFKKMKLGYKKGFIGWDDPKEKDYLLGKLNSKISEINGGDYNQFIDIANYAMMLENMLKRGKK